MAGVPPEEGADGSPRVAKIPVASSTHSSESAAAQEKPDGGDGGSRTSIGTKAFDVVMIKDPKSASGESSCSNHAGGGVGGGCDSIGRNGGDDMDIDGDKAKEPTTTTGTPKGPSIPTQGGPAWGEYDPDECFICFDGGEIILCDYCNRSYRLQCHRPPLKEVPEGKFKCMECVAVSSWGVGSSQSRPVAGDGVSDKGKKRAQSDAPNFVDPSEAAVSPISIVPCHLYCDILSLTRPLSLHTPFLLNRNILERALLRSLTVKCTLAVSRNTIKKRSFGTSFMMMMTKKTMIPGI